jgi:hypothetical protein
MKKIFSKIILLSSAYLLVSCTTVVNLNQLNSSKNLMVKDSSILILIPEDGAFGTEVYTNSGKTTTNELKLNFYNFTNTVDTKSDCKDLASLKKIKDLNYSYYVIPEILHWEERATEWSGIPSRIQIKIDIYNSKFERISSIVFEGRSASVTFVRKAPFELIEDEVKQYIYNLYGSKV